MYTLHSAIIFFKSWFEKNIIFLSTAEKLAGDRKSTRLNEAVKDLKGTVTVLNLSEYDLELAGAATSDCEGNPGKTGIIVPGGAGVRK